MKPYRRPIILVATFLLLYVAGYVFLSARGDYVKGAWGFGWTDSYVWVPDLFVSGHDGLDRPRVMQILYFPLWFAEARFIRWEKRGPSGRPINNVKPGTAVRPAGDNGNTTGASSATPPR